MSSASRSPDRSMAIAAREHGWSGARVADIVSTLTLLAVAASFTFRDGAPGLRHDWLWPTDSRVLERWFVEFALSVWNPHGLGSGTQAASFDWVLATFAALAALGLSSGSILFVVLSGGFVAATYGVGYLVRDALAVPVDRYVVRALGVAYALGPVCFQKAVAGHLLWLAAYAALPWFVAFVWLGCRRDAGPRAFYAAAVIYAFSSAQIQFLAFDAVAMLTIVAAHGFHRKALFGALLVIGVGIVHNASSFIAPFDAASGFTLADVHATRAWEVDMSAPLPVLALGDGYENYVGAALPPGLAWLPHVGSFALIALAILGVVRRLGRPALVFATVGIAALVFASGWYGPAAPLLDAALRESAYFTLFRELYHVMALYALALVVLAAYGCAALPRRVATAAATLALVAAVPFFSGGWSRLVPTVPPVAGERESTYGSSPLRLVFPYPEPLSAPGLSTGGADPARMDDDVIDTMNAPPYVAWLASPDLDLARQRSLAADLGVDEIADRDGRVAFLAHLSEPGIGASFADFDRRQRATRRRFAQPILLRDVRAAVELETTPERDRLQDELADHDLPPGADVSFASSNRGNNIDRQWVSLRGWSWMVPQLTNLNAPAVLTRSGTPLRLDIRTVAMVYVLAAGRGFALGGRASTSSSAAAGAYRWWRWPGVAAGPTSLSCEGLCAVARVRVSQTANWVARAKSSEPARRGLAVASDMVWPWLVTGVVPATGRTTLVFARSYFRGWHLVLDGRDLGTSRPVDAVFNGWTVDASASARSMRLEFEPQRRANALVVIAASVEGALIVACFAGRRRRPA